MLNNLAALGVGRIVPVSVVGVDGEGFELRQALERTPGVVIDHLVAAPDRRTPTYTKPMLTENGQTRELNRLDIKNRRPLGPVLEAAVIERLDAVWPSLDALLVLDQVSEEDCGVVTRVVRDRLARVAAADPEKFVLADSRERIGLFRAVCVKPNHLEWAKAGSATPAGVTVDYLPGQGPLDRFRAVFLTSGADGVEVIDPPAVTRVPAYPVAGPIDVCGAGDSCSAGIACAMVSGASYEQAAAFGNLIASITVQQIGTTGTASPEQVRRRWRDVTEPRPHGRD